MPFLTEYINQGTLCPFYECRVSSQKEREKRMTDLNNDAAIWRKVTDNDIENAIKGSLVGQIYNLLQKNYDTTPPATLCLTQAITNVSMALVHKKDWYKNLTSSLPQPNVISKTEDDDIITRQEAKMLSAQSKQTDEVDLNELLNGFSISSPNISDAGVIFQKAASPAHRSGIYIDTKMGNVPNVFSLVVAPSGFGKSLSLISQVAKAIGYTEITDTTLAGIQEEAMKGKPIVLSFQEFGKYLNTEFAVSEFRTGLTDMFSAGSFYRTTAGNKHGKVYSCDWFYPTLLGSVQPAVIKKRATQHDIAQGFLARMLVAYIDDNGLKPHVSPINICEDKDFSRVIVSLAKLSRQEKVVSLPNDDYNIKFAKPIEGILKPALKPFLNRYASEYLPRIALMLAIPENYDGTPIPDITEERLKKATVIMHHYLYNVEKAFYGLNDLTGKQKQFEDDIRKMTELMNRLHKKGIKNIKLSNISHQSSGSGWDCTARMEILNEMLQREMIELSNRKTTEYDQVQRGDLICLKYDKYSVACTLGA